MRTKAQALRAVGGFLVLSWLTLGCHSTATVTLVSGRRAAGGEKAPKPPSQLPSRSRGPWLLPRFERTVPRHVRLVAPDEAQLIVDGLRVGFFVDGSYRLGSGWLNVGRDVQVLTIPVRLGGGNLFVLLSNEDTWLYRARDFTSPLQPLGRIDQAVTTVTPGFTSLGLRLRQSGALVALEPQTGELSWQLDLPELPEYGPFVAVDDWFGAYVDPLRGLMVTQDAGHRYERFQSSNMDYERIEQLGSIPFGSPGQIEGLRAVGDALEVTLTGHSRFLLTRRGDVEERTSEQKNSAAHVSEKRGVTSWLNRLRESVGGGWPIELAVARGILFSDNVALYVEKGVLYYVTLDEGKVVRSLQTEIPRDQQCYGATGQRQHYFLCHDRIGSALYRFDGTSGVALLGYWAQRRSWGAVTDAGVILQGACDDSRANASDRKTYCAVSNAGKSFEFGTTFAPARGLPLLVSEGQAVVFELPLPGEPGTLHWYGLRQGKTDVVWPKSEASRGLLEDGYFLRELTLQQGHLSGYLIRGDALQGYRVALDGSLRLGPLVIGSEVALTKGPFALVPDSSGYAHESLDGGMTWQRSMLPISVASTKLGIPATTTEYGCNVVGCFLGDFMRLGWSPRQSTALAGASSLATLESPTRLTLERRRRRMPRINCEVTAATELSPRGNLAVRGQVATRVRNDEPRALEFESTAWPSFYGVMPPARATGEIGFDRAFQSDRYVGHLYAHFRQDEKPPTTSIEARVLDGLGTSKPWSTKPLRYRFEQVETLARWFTHPRYGESSVPLSTLFDVGGQTGLLVFDDMGKLTSFLLTANEPLVVLPPLLGHHPKRITDFVSLKEASYLLGTEPRVALFELRGQQVRIVSEEDYRAHLGHARLRLVRDRRRTRIGYLLSSIRLRSADVIWSLYPIDVVSGAVSSPLRIPLDTDLRVCTPEDDGWLVEAELDDVADAHLLPENVDVMGRGQALLLANEQGLCVERVSFKGQLSAVKLQHGSTLNELKRTTVDEPNRFGGLYRDTQGHGRPLACSISP